MTDSDNKPKKPDAPTHTSNPNAQLQQRLRAQEASQHEQQHRPRNEGRTWQSFDLGIGNTGGHFPFPLHSGDIKKDVRSLLSQDQATGEKAKLGRILITQNGVYCNPSDPPLEGILLWFRKDSKKDRELIKQRDPLLSTLLAWYGAKEARKKHNASFSPADDKEIGMVLKITGRDRETVLRASAICAAMGIPFHCDHPGENDEAIAKYREQYASYGLTEALRDKSLVEILEIFGDSSKLDALMQEDPKHYKVIRNSRTYQSKTARERGQALLKDLSQDLREVSKTLELITPEQSTKLDHSTVSMDFKQDENTPEGLTITHRPTR